MVSPSPAERAPSALLAGTPYRAIRLLGVGGMGEVFEAEHTGLAKPVVVKLLRSQYSEVPALVERLRVEAQVLARLSSPHIVTVTDFGTTPGGRAFLVMERLYGQPLDLEIRARDHLPLKEAIGITLDVLAGLQVAHDAGLVHRDIKSSNIFLCDGPKGSERRLAKVLDFGVVKVLAGAGMPAIAMPTAEGLVVGTPRVVAPEQARGKRVDARTDLYAVGVLLYTMLVGHDPFAHVRDMMGLLKAHIEETPSAPSIAATQFIPKSLDRAILRALSKDPDDRYPSASAFADALRAVLLESEPPARPSKTVPDEDGTLPFRATELPPLGSTAVTELLPAVAPSRSAVGRAQSGEHLAAQSVAQSRVPSDPEIASATRRTPSVRALLVLSALSALGFAVLLSLVALIFSGITRR